MPRPTALYVPHYLDVSDISPCERYSLIAQNLNCYGITVADNRRPEDIIAKHTTISGEKGDFCSTYGSRNITVFDPHQTEKSSLYFSILLEGNESIHGRKKTISSQVKPGILMVHERNDYFSYESNDVKQLYLNPNIDLVKANFNGRLASPMMSMENHPLSHFLKSHMYLLHKHSMELNIKMTSTLLDGLHNMALLMLADVAKDQGIKSSGSMSHIFNAARTFITQNYSLKNLSPDLIAKTLRFSRSSLDRAFKEQGTTTMATIKEVRLIKARELLENSPHMRIEQISWHCGFSSSFLFSKNYREKYKTSPKVWRENFNSAI